MLTELFTSKTRIRLLLKLFLNSDLSCYLRELAAEFKVYILDDYAQGKDSGIIDLLIIGYIDRDKLERYVELTEGKIERKVRVLVELPEDFIKRQELYFQRPHWKVILQNHMTYSLEQKNNHPIHILKHHDTQGNKP